MRVDSSTRSGRFSGEIAGEEDDEDHLQQLRRLAGDGPDRERQAGAVHVVPEHERQQEQHHARRGPRVLVAAQPDVAADGDGQHGDDRQPDHEPDQLRSREPAEAPGQRLRQALHQQEPDAAQQPDRRQQDLVRAPPGEHEREVHGEQRTEVDREQARIGRPEEVHGPGVAVQLRCAEALRRAEREAPDEQAKPDEAKQHELPPAETGCDPGSAGLAPDGAQAACCGGHARARSSRSRACPIWISSPNAIGASPSTWLPLTNVPFVDPRSSTYQARPR